jgi:hypothetical protein
MGGEAIEGTTAWPTTEAAALLDLKLQDLLTVKCPSLYTIMWH